MIKLCRKLLAILKAKSGMILPMALVLMAAGAFIIVPGLWAMQAAMSMNRISEADFRAFYAADEGIVDAFWKMNYQSVPAFPYSLPVPINGFYVTVRLVQPPVEMGDITYYTIQASTSPAISMLPAHVGAGTGIWWGDPYLFTATASNPSVIAEIRRQITHGNNVFDYAMVSLTNDFTLGGNSSISSDNNTVSRGDIFSNNNIIMWGDSVVYGAATAVGSVTGCTHVQGACTTGATSITMPPIDILTLKNEALAGGTQSGSTISNSTSIGPKYINGNLTIRSSAVLTLTGTVYVNGDIEVKNSATIRGGQTIVAKNSFNNGGGASILTAGNVPLVITETGSINVQNNSQVSMIAYTPNGAVTVGGGALIYGSVVGQSVSLSGGSGIKYLSGIRQIDQLAGVGSGVVVTITKYVYG